MPWWSSSQQPLPTGLPSGSFVHRAGVNLIGEHTDYNLGLVLPVAIDREIHIAAVPTGDRRVELTRLDTGERLGFELDIDRPRDGRGSTTSRARHSRCGTRDFPCEASEASSDRTCRRAPASHPRPHSSWPPRGRSWTRPPRQPESAAPCPDLPARRERVRRRAYRSLMISSRRHVVCRVGPPAGLLCCPPGGGPPCRLHLPSWSVVHTDRPEAARCFAVQPPARAM